MSKKLREPIDFKELSLHLDLADMHETYLAFFDRNLKIYISYNYIYAKNKNGVSTQVYNWVFL